MKRIALALGLAVVALALSVANAQPISLSEQLTVASMQYQTQALKAYYARQLAVQKMHNDERVAAVGMGWRETRQMLQMDAIQGPDQSNVPSTSQPWTDAHTQAKAAYEAWIAGKAPQQVADAKKLYASWLTMMSAINTMDDPTDVASTPAGTAWEQARNEFDIDYGTQP